MQPMEGQNSVDSVIEYALFQMSSTENSYNALACINGKVQKLSSGSLDQLALHFPQVKEFSSRTPIGSFKLLPTGGLSGSPWFTKMTLSWVLHIINSPEAMNSASTILNEMSQLEATRQFHLALYTKEQIKSDGDISGGKSGGSRSPSDAKVETTSDETKSELIRALNLRLTALGEELCISMKRAIGANLSVNRITNLVAFVEHFGLSNLRSQLLEYRSLIPMDKMDESFAETVNLEEPADASENFTEEVCQPGPGDTKSKPLCSGISPAKIAEAERQSSSENDDFSESSNEDDQKITERSRPLIRSSSPRRSASPMRRIQIGRSGSRRSTALTIKSLSYFPTRERASSNREDDEGNNKDSEPRQPPQRPDVNVTRISVQDAISLFESKQKDQNTDEQKRRASGGVSLNANKSVLRRWSSFMGDSLNCSQESVSEPLTQNNSLTPEVGENTATPVAANSENVPSIASTSETAVTLSKGEKIMAPPNDFPTVLTTSQDEVIDKEITMDDWSKQKEAELNQMLLKLIESKPGKYGGTKAGRNQTVASSNEKKGGFYSQYKEKRDEKLRAENDGRRSVMEAQFKVLKETLEQSRKGVASKSGSNSRKPDSPLNSQKPRRNSSPPVLSKKEVPKTTPSKKVLPKASLSPSTRSLQSPGSIVKANELKPAKTSSKQTSTNVTPNRRKSQPTSPAPPSPKPERVVHQLKEKQVKRNGVKSPVSSKEEKTQKPTSQTKKSLNSKTPLASRDATVAVPEKPRIYSKATKKSSVVPMEGKHTPRKGAAGNGPALGSVGQKPKVSLSDDSPKNNGNLIIRNGEKESSPNTAESTTKVLEVDLAQQANGVDANLEISLDNNLNLEKTEISDENLAALDDDLKVSVGHCVTEIEPDEGMSISAAAWVEVDYEQPSAVSGIDPLNDTVAPALPSQGLSSPRVRHSLSQMLQADNSEPEIIEWGNAENPPALIYQKDASKGFKRLLKFARKSKGESNMTGCASPSIYSEGEDDTDDYKAVSRKNSDVARKAGIAKGHGPHRTMLGNSVDTRNLSKRADYQGENEILTAQPNCANVSSFGSDKWDNGALLAATTSKSSRSFFSFSTFRSGKSSESKPR